MKHRTTDDLRFSSPLQVERAKVYKTTVIDVYNETKEK